MEIIEEWCNIYDRSALTLDSVLEYLSARLCTFTIHADTHAFTEQSSAQWMYVVEEGVKASRPSVPWPCPEQSRVLAVDQWQDISLLRVFCFVPPTMCANAAAAAAVRHRWACMRVPWLLSCPLWSAVVSTVDAVAAFIQTNTRKSHDRSSPLSSTLAHYLTLTLFLSVSLSLVLIQFGSWLR